MEIKIVEKTEVYTRLNVIHEGTSHIFDISSSVPDDQIEAMADYYIKEITKLNEIQA